MKLNKTLMALCAFAAGLAGCSGGGGGGGEGNKENNTQNPSASTVSTSFSGTYDLGDISGTLNSDNTGVITTTIRELDNGKLTSRVLLQYKMNITYSTTQSLFQSPLPSTITLSNIAATSYTVDYDKTFTDTTFPKQADQNYYGITKEGVAEQFHSTDFPEIPLNDFNAASQSQQTVVNKMITDSKSSLDEGQTLYSFNLYTVYQDIISYLTDNKNKAPLKLYSDILAILYGSQGNGGSTILEFSRFLTLDKITLTSTDGKNYQISLDQDLSKIYNLDSNGTPQCSSTSSDLYCIALDAGVDSALLLTIKDTSSLDIGGKDISSYGVTISPTSIGATKSGN